MGLHIPGLHHVTAIASDPQRTLDFYTEVLGLRLVKLTVNFDDPGTYHFYFGDRLGHPGTILTFFPWPGTRAGVPGNGQVARVAFTIPHESLGFWEARLKAYALESHDGEAGLDQDRLLVGDPDGLPLDLVAGEPAGVVEPWAGSQVPEEHAVRGFRGITLWEEGFDRTARLLTETMGLRLVAEKGSLFRFQGEEGAPGALVDLLVRPQRRRGSMGAGSVHHVAFRTASRSDQIVWRQRLADAGRNVTPVIDRQYFRSIYFREPGGVLFEIATDPPGFAIDESADALGTSLKLPDWLEPERDWISRMLPELRLPQPTAVATGV